MFARITLTFIICTLTVAVAQGAVVWGYCYLEEQPLPCLTVVEIDEGVLHVPDITDSDGRYDWLAVIPGAHTFTYSHPGYATETHVFTVPFGGGRLPDVTLESKAICDPADWNHYPYALSEPEPDFTFPDVEGMHDPTSTFRAEWWYVNFHLFTDENNHEYGGFVAFFKPPIVGLPCMVLQSIIDLEDGVPYYSHDEFPAIFLANDQWLDVTAGGNRLKNRECEGELLPFEYHLYAGWVEGGIVQVELDMKDLKPPFAVCGDGYEDFGDAGGSYYYTHPRLDVLGKIHLPGFPAAGKDVHGYAWIDHQWGNWTPDTVTWEWISIQLDDDRDIMVFDAWANDETLVSCGLNYYDENCSLEVLEDYNMTVLDSYVDPVTENEFATQWRVTESSRQMDLVVTADDEDQIMRIGENLVFRTCFWEGACGVSGTIGGQPVEGTAYAEVTHAPPDWQPPGCPNPGDAGRFCTADIYPNNADGVWCYDYDGDCVVELADLAQLLGNYGCTAGCTHEMGDVFPKNGDGAWEDGVDGDGVIDLNDLAEMLGQYGDNCAR